MRRGLRQAKCATEEVLKSGRKPRPHALRSATCSSCSRSPVPVVPGGFRDLLGVCARWDLLRDVGEGGDPARASEEQGWGGIYIVI